ncbi:MAG TPA: PAS domain S-box protein, partial [Caldilineae bacterium]|nr:PAS domain S-box protein [Caldilineae bacterium]
MEQAPVGIVVVDMEGIVIDINATALQILGSPGRDVSLGLNVLTLPALVESGVSDLFYQVLANDEPIELETEYTSRWGRRAYLRTRLAPRFDTRGKQIGVIQFLEDVSERKRIELALELNRERYAMAAEAAQVGVWDWDLVTNEFYLDPTIKAMLGYTDEE